MVLGPVTEHSLASRREASEWKIERQTPRQAAHPSTAPSRPGPNLAARSVEKQTPRPPARPPDRPKSVARDWGVEQNSSSSCAPFRRRHFKNISICLLVVIRVNRLPDQFVACPPKCWCYSDLLSMRTNWPELDVLLMQWFRLLALKRLNTS